MDEDSFRVPNTDSPFGYVIDTAPDGEFGRFCTHVQCINAARSGLARHYFDIVEAESSASSSESDEYTTSDEDSEADIITSERQVRTEPARQEAVHRAGEGHSVGLGANASIEERADEARVRQRGAAASPPTTTTWHDPPTSATLHDPPSALDELSDDQHHITMHNTKKRLTVASVELWPAFLVYRKIIHLEGHLALRAGDADDAGAGRGNDTKWDEVILHWLGKQQHQATVYDAALDAFMFRSEDYLSRRKRESDEGAAELLGLLTDIRAMKVQMIRRSTADAST